MRLHKTRRMSTRCGKLLPALFLCYGIGCLPDNAVNQVLGENLVFTVAIIVQTITSTFFNTLFSLF